MGFLSWQDTLTFNGPNAPNKIRCLLTNFVPCCFLFIYLCIFQL
jgi:hypothetical protein